MQNIGVNKALARWKHIDFSNRFMFRLVMERPELCQKTLEVILGIKIKRLKYLEAEKSFEAQLQNKGVRLDVYIEDIDGVAYDLEMQASDADGYALGKRARYYHSLIDQTLLKKGNFYADLKQSLVIFICKYDPFGAGLLRYTFSNVCREKPTIELNDESVKIFINTLGHADNISLDLLNFVNFINTGVSNDAFTQKLAAAVEHERNDSGKAVLYMTWEQTMLEEQRKGEIKGIQQGKFEEKKATAIRMHKKGYSNEAIAECANVPVSSIIKWIAGNQ